jgi:ABC-type transport system involved in Fe-S cluster assembly fused permease/ATPase subunit
MAFFLGFADTPHLQIGMVSGILAYKFGSTFAWITSASVATYIAFTLAITQVQTQYYAVKPISLKIFLWFQLFKSSCDV